MRWHDAAARASFMVYEPDNVTSRWAGGFSFDGSVIEVMGALAGDEVSVETSRPDRSRPDDLQQRIAISELIWRYVLGDTNEFDLPYSVTIEADARAVMVDSVTHTVHGMRVGAIRVGWAH